MSLTASRARLRFHPLTVAGVRPVAADGSAVAVTFEVPEELREEFAFRPGQHVPGRPVAGGREVRRAYSICSTPAELSDEGTLMIGVRRVPGGAVSTHACGGLRAGDRLELLPPVGAFSAVFDPAQGRSYGAVAGGSGITPVLSLLRTGLATEPRSVFTVVYANRGADSMMFGEELADLKNRYLDRFRLVHVFSREEPHQGLAGGRLDAARLGRLLAGFPACAEWFACGPPGLVTAARTALTARGVDAVHTELFRPEPTADTRTGLARTRSDHTADLRSGDARSSRTADLPSGDTRSGRTAAPRSGDARTGSGRIADPRDVPLKDTGRPRLEVVMDGRTSAVVVGDGETLLQAALPVRPELPYSCENGVCGTCRALLVSGGARMTGAWALSEDERAAGYVLTCRATPVTDHVRVDFDAL